MSRVCLYEVGIIQWFLFTMDVLQFWLRLRFFLFACVWLSFPSLRSGLLNENQYETLQGIYNSLNGPQWNVYSNEVAWNFNDDSDPCVDHWLGLP